MNMQFRFIHKTNKFNLPISKFIIINHKSHDQCELLEFLNTIAVQLTLLSIVNIFIVTINNVNNVIHMNELYTLNIQSIKHKYK